MATYYIDLDNGSDSADGTTWANAWKTITLGATAARIAPGDIIRISKTPDPTSIGNATWTNLSKTVTLASAQTELLYNGTGLTASGDSSLSSITGKYASNANKITLDSSPQTSTLQAYKETGTLDLSSYQKISFWVSNSAVIVANNWKVCLCSDTAGATPVDTFYITAIPSTTRWLPLTLTKDGGGNLGSSIQSIAIYTDSVAPTASSYIVIDNVNACTTSGLNLQSLISKNSSAQGGTEGYYGIKSIDGTTILLDNDTSVIYSNGQGYYGTTETVTTYKRETFKTDISSGSTTAISTITDSGTLAGGNIEYQFGYEVGTTNQNGETYLDGLNGWGCGVYLVGTDFATIKYVNMFRYYYGLYISTSANNLIISNISNINNCLYGIYINSSSNNTLSISNASNCNYGIYILGSVGNTITTGANNNNTANGIIISSGSKNIIYSTYLCNNLSYGLSSVGDNYFYNTLFESNGVSIYSINRLYLFNSESNDSDIFSSQTYTDSMVYFHDLDSQYNHTIHSRGANANMQSTTTQTGSGYAWKVVLTSTERASVFPFKLPLAKVACESGKTITVKAYCKKDAASTVQAKLVCNSTWIDGVTEQTDTKADDTDWEELSISFTPTENGVVEIEGWNWCTSTTSANVYWDSMTITST
jgi:parallel beta-helix repeat protein